MKKSSSPGGRTPAARKAAVRPPPAEIRTCLEVAAPTALAAIDPPVALPTSELRRVRFRYFNPEARAVHVVGSFNGWDPRATPMQRDAMGDWSVEIDLPTGEHRYRFFVDGEWRDDPSAQQSAQNPFGGFDAIMTVV